MFSNAALSPDKTMDEILASIRQTITEELNTVNDIHSDNSSTRTGADEVLELTKNVQEDGTVIDLKEDKAMAQDAGEKNMKTTNAEESTSDQEAQNDSAVAEQEEVKAKVEDLKLPGDTKTGTAAPDLAGEKNDETASNIASSLENSFFEENTSESQAEQPSAMGEQIISDQTVHDSLAALSSFKNLSKHSHLTDENPSNAPQTIDGLVRELLKPMLREWLDANLPSLVKWIVTEQVERVFKDMKK